MTCYERRLRERGLSEEEIRDTLDELQDDYRRDKQDRSAPEPVCISEEIERDELEQS